MYFRVVVFCMVHWSISLLNIGLILGALLPFGPLAFQGHFCSLQSHSVFLNYKIA